MSIDVQSRGNRGSSGEAATAAVRSEDGKTGRKHPVFQWHNPLLIMALQELSEKLRAPKCAIMEAALVGFQAGLGLELKHRLGAGFSARAQRLKSRTIAAPDWSHTNGDWQEYVEERAPNKPLLRKDGLPDGRSPKESKNRCCELNLRQTWEYVLALKELSAEMALPEVEIVERAFWLLQAEIDGPLECRRDGGDVE